MHLLRKIAALPLALVLFWAMVVAPSAIARCEHACGTTHLHASDAGCDSEAHDGCGDHDSPDKAPPGKKTGDCRLIPGDDVAPGEPASLKTPPPVDFVPQYFLTAPVFSDEGSPVADPDANSPPRPPPDETHGRGALPLLL